MATPLDSESLVLSYSITSEGTEISGEYGLRSLTIRKQVNAISYAKLVFLDGDVTTGEFVLSKTDNLIPGKKIKVSLGTGTSTKPVFEGMVVNHNISLQDGVSLLEIECWDQALKLTTVRRNRFFEKTKDSDAISKIIKESGLSANVDGTSVKHEQLVQYQSTDWDFVLARAEANGLIVITEDNKLTVTKPDPSKSSSLELEYGVSLLDFDLSISSYRLLESVKVSAWDVKNQKLESADGKAAAESNQGNLSGKKLASVMGSKAEIPITAPITKDEATAYANGIATRAALDRMKGTITLIGWSDIEVNTSVKFKGLGDRFNGDAYITGVQHVFEPGDWRTILTLGIDATAAAQKYPDLNAPPAGGLLSGAHGMQVGVVSKIDSDPENNLRIQVTVPSLADKKVWARMGHPYASAESGTFFMPEIGDEVILGFFNDDPRYPVVLGSLYSGKNKGKYTPDDKNKTKAIVTKSGIVIEMDEEKKILTLKTPGKNSIIISDEDKGITLEDANGNSIALNDSGIEIKSSKKLVLKDGSGLEISSGAAAKIKGTTGLDLEGQNINVKAQMAASVQGLTAEVKASTQATIKGAMVMIN